jgi:hypothetical protein
MIALDIAHPTVVACFANGLSFVFVGIGAPLMGEPGAVFDSGFCGFREKIVHPITENVLQ